MVWSLLQLTHTGAYISSGYGADNNNNMQADKLIALPFGGKKGNHKYISDVIYMTSC